MPLLKYQKWEETLPHGPPLCALCMGNDKYESSSFPALNSCVKDAKAVAAQVRNKLGELGAWATDVGNIKDKAAMELEVKHFLRQIRRPPRMVLVYVSGHGVQEGDEIFLVPTHASPSNLEELRAQCLSHDELFRILKTDLEERDVPDLGKTGIKINDIIFLVILDTCRVRLGAEPVQLEESYSAELDPKNPPNVWALCAATSRHKEAFENPAISQELSAFTHYLISEDVGCGLFEPNTPVKEALETACNKLRERVKDKKQDPTLMGLDRIPPNFCLLCAEAPLARYDVCVCYRRDTDDDHAQFICDKLRTADHRISLNSGDVATGMEDAHIANAIAHSTIVVLIVSEKTFAGVDELDAGSPCQGPLADFLLQCELIVEIYGRRQERMKVFPTFFGVERDAPGGGKMYEVFDGDVLWPETAPACCVKAIAERAKTLIRCLGSETASLLTHSNLTIPSRSNVASLMNGRTIKDTLLVLKGLARHKLEGRKRDAGELVSREIVKLLDMHSSKRVRESDESEAGAGAKRANTDSRDGSKAAEKRAHDAGEGSSSRAKRSRQDPDPASASMSGGSRVGEEGAASGGGGAGLGRAGTDPTDSQEEELPNSINTDNICMENISRFTSHEMKNTWDAVVAYNVPPAETLVCHYTDIKSAELIIQSGSPGFRASTVGQAGGGFYVVVTPPHEMGWDRYQGGAFRATVGRELWGERASNVLLGGCEAQKLDVVFLIKIPRAWIEHEGGLGVPGRPAIKIIPPSSLCKQSDGHHYLQKEKILRCYVLKGDKEDLLREQEATAKAMSSRPASPAPSELSDVTTAPGTPQSPSSQEVAAMHVPNEVREFRDDMKKLIEGFLAPQSGAAGEQPALRQFNLCELLLVAFMRDKVAPCRDEEIAENLDAWQEKCEDLVRGSPDADLITAFSKLMLSLKPSVFEEIQYDFAQSSRKNHTSVFAIDWMVRHSESSLKRAKRDEWAEEVAQGWFASESAESADGFLERAEKFLRKGVKGESWGAKILGKVIQTNSYVIFFRMEALAALLLREHCGLQTKPRTRRLMQQEHPEPAKGGPLLPPISLMVSSSGWHLSAAEGSDVNAAQMVDITARLQRIATLPEELLEANACLLSKIEFVEWEPLYSLASGKKNGEHGDGGCDDDDGEDRDGDDDMGDGGGTGAAAGGASSRGDRGSSKTDRKLNKLFAEKMVDVQKYLNALKEQVEYYHDAASGEKMQVDEQESISLKAVPSHSAASRLEADPKAVQEDMICPINLSLMHDPVRCFDGQFSHTYERSAIIMHFERAQQEGKAAKSPKSNLELLTRQVDGKFELVLEPDIDMRQKIAVFKQQVSKLEARKKHEAEGDEERQLLLRRLGYDAHQESVVEKSGEVIRCATELLSRLVKGDFICVIGPPACGKTITMFQTTCAAVAEAKAQLETRLPGSPPRLPVFMRAAELAKILATTDSANVQSLEALVQLYISDKYQNDLSAMHLLTEVLKLKRVLILIDGLDEAAKYRSTIEGWIDQASVAQNVGLMVSTREYAFESSRAYCRLSEFVPVKIQELDEGAINRLLATRFQGSLSSLRQGFIEQLESVVQNYPEMKRSPLMLCLLIEVFKRERAIPSKRHLLYQELVRGLAISHMAKHDTGKRRSRRLQGSAADDATEFLAALAFVCHMHLKQRDFVLSSDSLQGKMREIWQDKSSTLDDMSECLLRSTVGLLSRVGEDEYRFSHLTLQEYLAARYTVGVHGNDAKQLMDKLKPLKSAVSKDGLWNKEVSRFVAGMLKEDVFVQFCKLILEGDDETGSCCEIVQDFLNEREQSSQTRPLEEMVCSKIQRIRGADLLLAGLCHPCPEMRKLVLSEMKQFRVPPNPFADGTVARLQEIAKEQAPAGDFKEVQHELVQAGQKEETERNSAATPGARPMRMVVACPCSTRLVFEVPPQYVGRTVRVICTSCQSPIDASTEQALSMPATEQAPSGESLKYEVQCPNKECGSTLSGIVNRKSLHLVNGVIRITCPKCKSTIDCTLKLNRGPSQLLQQQQNAGNQLASGSGRGWARQTHTHTHTHITPATAEEGGEQDAKAAAGSEAKRQKVDGSVVKKKEQEKDEQQACTYPPIPKDTSHVWHKRAAAMLSLAQIAKMKHWETSRSDRAETIRWMLELLQSGSDVLDNVHFALVKALGTILQEGGVSAAGEGVMLQPEDESVLLQQPFCSSVANALSDLKIFSAGLVDRLEREPSVIATGQWPIEHVHFLCENVAASNGSERALHLAGSLLHRLHSASFQTSDRALLLKSLGALQSLVAADLYSQVLPFLESGDAEQRARVLAAAVEIKIQFRGEDAIGRLARCLLLDVGAASTHAASGTSLLSYVLKEEAEKCKGFLLREKSTVVLFLVNIMNQSSGDFRKVVSREILDVEGKMAAERLKQKEKEKDEGKLAAGATTSLPAPAAARGQTKDSAADRPDVSLQALDDALTLFTPSSQFPYFTARLWSDADLMQAPEIEEAEFEEDAEMFQALRSLNAPWFEGYGAKRGVWEKKVVGALQTKTLGRFVFGMLLSYIKNQVARVHEGAIEALGALGKEIQAWDCEKDREKQLERNFLLKELRIGRRAQELPTWAGLVNTSAYNISEEDPAVLQDLLLESLHPDWDPFESQLPPGARAQPAGDGGSAAAPDDATGGLGSWAHHRPVFNVLLDAMTHVTFRTEQARDEWGSYNVDQDFQRSLEFGLAQVIGRYLHAGELSSPVLGSFYQALQAPDPAGPLPYYQKLQAIALDAQSMPAVTASLAAIYCYWRIEQELLDPMYASQLARWQGADIMGHLLQILGQLQQGAHPASQENELVIFFAQVHREIQAQLRECGPALQYYCSNTE